MKTPARVVSWVFGIIGMLISLYNVFTIETLLQELSQYKVYKELNISIDFARNLMLGIAIFQIIVVVSILVWRDLAVEKGNKVACGICTLLFVSKIGGILTLLITDEEMKKPTYI